MQHVIRRTPLWRRPAQALARRAAALDSFYLPCPSPPSPQDPPYTRIAMSNDTPSAEDKARYDAARKELLHALAKKRALDKQLASPFPLTSSLDTDDAGLLHAVST